MPRTESAVDPIETVMMVMEEHEWSYEKDVWYLVAEVAAKQGGTPYDVSASYDPVEGTLSILCGYRLGDDANYLDERAADVLDSLIVDLNEGLFFGRFCYNRRNKVLGFCHSLLVAGLTESVLANHVEYVVYGGLGYCAVALPLFEQALRTLTRPSLEHVELFVLPDKGRA